MRPTLGPTQKVTAYPPEALADTTAGAISGFGGDELAPHLADIADVIASADDDLPSDPCTRKKSHLRLWGCGRERFAHARQQR